MVEFEKEAKELLDRINKLINEGKSIAEIKKEIEAELAKYNEDVRQKIESEIFAILDEVPPDVLVGPALSDRLYENAKEVSAMTAALIAQHIRAKKTIGELAKELYEGYGVKDKEILGVVKKLPEYLQKEFNNPMAVKKLLKKVNQLKTSPLRAAYTKIVDEIEKMDKRALDKAKKVALEEKARYYAKRIAQTEIFRAKNYKNAMEYLEDDEIELVKYEMSSYHPKVDICDFYAKIDVGYGPGIVPKEEMRTLPLHPFCRCRYRPYYPPPHKKRKIKNIKPEPFDKAAKKTMSRFSEYEQRQILGSRQKLAEFKSGASIESIFNRLRPKYPIRRYVDVLGYNSRMEKYKRDLAKFIEEIKIKNIKRNDIVIGEFHRNVLIALDKKGIQYNKEIFLTVRRYFHITRDFKKHKNKVVPEHIIKNFPFYLTNPFKMYFDNHRKHRNVIFVFEYKKKLFKIVVNPSGEIVTAGNVNIGNLENESIFEEIKR